ncbi:DUF1998 domain-containing protein [Alkaliphilus oremlandii]|uniref:MrfA-like Zn-binding domain-containing protein n=1 Tax=Alkaliphilus oremlandii (strain OhILAs) TaxID=350688 RepID=A8MID6_ALKOO|nr:DUF1998 domain-containing protein [Alkaliphilus oremlandii]ABW19568.1 conserved hypothetical protein [Alkaliphilus oremlandii OhILAs]
MNLNTERNKQKRVVGTVRQTQLVTTFGCGSIVDLPHDSVIIAGLDFWNHADNEKFRLSEVNLEKYLGVKYFVKPKVVVESGDNPFSKLGSRDVPAFRFPEILICSRCGKIENYKWFKLGKKMKCRKCGETSMIPSRFVVACENGHLEDFPYGWWVHRGDPDSCENHDLYMFNSKESGGLESILIYCKTCKENGKERYTRNMDGSFSKVAFAGNNVYKCSGNRPWLRDQDTKDCNAILRTAQRGGTNLYFTKHASALSIPPWSSRIQAEFDNYVSLIRGINPEDDLMINLILESKKPHEKCNCTKEEAKEQLILRIKNMTDNKGKTEIEIVQDEYRAFIGQEDISEEHFTTKQGDIPEFLTPYIDKIVLVEKLREVLVLRGFTRINSDVSFEDEKEKLAPITIKKNPDWLPAIELNGEGIFLKLNEEKLRRWEENPDVIKRCNILKQNMERVDFKNEKFSPRYILLHTLSHLLIQQLILECGYSTSSIKEKIYSTFNKEDNEYNMAGILIYTATPDSEGSLGGLVYEGRKDRLENTFKSMLESASWCSSDPLCIQSHGQGLNSLNLAACHSCALLPETSCEMRNLFLDRATVVGKLDNKKLGFFSELLLEEK